MAEFQGIFCCLSAVSIDNRGVGEMGGRAGWGGMGRRGGVEWDGEGRGG